jgi:hypothetical protein
MSEENDDILIPQLELGPRLGGMKELATRLSFYNGIANSLMVAALYYGDNPMIPVVNMPLHSLAPTIAIFYGILVVCAGFLAVFEHVFVVRAQAEYNQINQFGENVSPIRRHLQEVQEDIEELDEKLEDRND